MIRARISIFALCLALSLLAGCVPRDPNAAARAATVDSLQVAARLQRYSYNVLNMDHAGIAEMFAHDGELRSEGQATLVGPERIHEFLNGFLSYKVLAEQVTADSTEVRADSAWQIGTYRQRVRVPDGKLVEVSGSFEVKWGRDATGQWMIRNMRMTPAR